MEEQLPLFQRKSFPATLKQGIGTVVSPKPENTILFSLSSYFTYLGSQGYSQYTPADFCGDVKKFGLFVGQKPLREITTQDIREWVSELRTRQRMTDKTIFRKLSALNNYFTTIPGEWMRPT
jgi:site-specific recombinase XerD